MSLKREEIQKAAKAQARREADHTTVAVRETQRRLMHQGSYQRRRLRQDSPRKERF